jgi:hypothetical protein
MEKKYITILLSVAGILLIAFVFYLGMLFQSSSKIQLIKNQTVSTLSSKTVSSINAYGKVSNINGKNVTLSNLGDRLVILMTDTSHIYSIVAPSLGKKTVNVPIQKTIYFEDIKVGDSVNVVLKLLSDGQLQGQSLVVLP